MQSIWLAGFVEPIGSLLTGIGVAWHRIRERDAVVGTRPGVMVEVRATPLRNRVVSLNVAVRGHGVLPVRFSPVVVPELEFSANTSHVGLLVGLGMHF
jgi:hypothetical protein